MVSCFKIHLRQICYICGKVLKTIYLSPALTALSWLHRTKTKSDTNDIPIRCPRLFPAIHIGNNNPVILELLGVTPQWKQFRVVVP